MFFFSCLISHPYPRKLILSLGQLKDVFMNRQGLDGDLVDVVIRRLNQLDLNFRTGNASYRWRHFLESDFAVRINTQSFVCLFTIYFFSETTYTVPRRSSRSEATHHTICSLFCTSFYILIIAFHNVQWYPVFLPPHPTNPRLFFIQFTFCYTLMCTGYRSSFSWWHMVCLYVWHT